MFQRFFDTNIEGKFIKSLLRNTPVPIVNTAADGDYLIAGCSYVYKNNIIKCTSSGYLNKRYLRHLVVSEYLYCSENLAVTDSGILVSEYTETYVAQPQTELERQRTKQTEMGIVITDLDTGEEYNYMFDTLGDHMRINLYPAQEVVETVIRTYEVQATYELVQPFTFGNDYPKFTEKYISTYSYYDSDTHYHLGKLLRAIRDVKGIDLMPFYNCYNHRMLEDVYLTTTGYEIKKNSAYKVFAVPVKFNKTYTIALDCAENVRMKSVIYGKLGMIKVPNDQSEYFRGSYVSDDIQGDFKSFGSMSFKRPVTYKVTNDGANAKLLQGFEGNLFMLIQVPAHNDSSLVVLEGDYTFTESVFNAENINNIFDFELDEHLLSKLSLLQINDKNTYAFANRLVEYLLLSVVHNQEDISDNISMVQESLIKNALKIPVKYSNNQKSIEFNYNKDNLKGIWNKYLRYFIYRYCTEGTRVDFTDINGFVDIDTERVIVKE